MAQRRDRLGSVRTVRQSSMATTATCSTRTTSPISALTSASTRGDTWTENSGERRRY